MAKVLVTPTPQTVVSIIFHLKGDILQGMTNSRTKVQNELILPKLKAAVKDSQGQDYSGCVSWTRSPVQITIAVD